MSVAIPEPSMPSRLNRRPAVSMIRRFVACLCSLPYRTTPPPLDRKSTRLNSSHSQISYAVFCLKKKKHHTDISNADPKKHAATPDTDLLPHVVSSCSPRPAALLPVSTDHRHLYSIWPL